MRNDSSNISAILAPNNYSPDAENSNPPSETTENQNPKRLTIYSSKYHRNHRIPKAHCESCYCREAPEKPTLRLKLASLFDDDICYKHPKRRHSKKSYCCKLVPDDILEKHSQNILNKVHDEVRYAPKSAFLRKLQEESHKNCEECPCCVETLAYTEQREEYEDLQPLYEQDYALDRLKSKEEVNKAPECSEVNHNVDKGCASDCPKFKEKMERAQIENQDVYKDCSLDRFKSKEEIAEARLKNQYANKDMDKMSAIKEEVDEKSKTSLTTEDTQHCDCCKCKSRFVTMSNSKNIQEIKEFREEKFFETHSSTNLTGENERSKTLHSLGQKDHECVHKFILNDRKLPEPLNCDPYGISRCVICGKPMEKPNLKEKKPDTRIRTKEQKNKKGNVTSPCKDITLVPRTVTIGSRKERIELQVPMDIIVNEQAKDKTVAKKYRPVLANSFALRYQKGVV